MQNFRTLDLAVDFYRKSKSIPSERPIKEQLQRASLSIALNLAEGRGKPTLKDQLRFFHIAMGSTRECQAILRILNIREDSEEWKTLDRLGASLFLLIKNAK